MKTVIFSVLLVTATVSITCKAQSKQNALLEEAKKAIAENNAIHFSLYAKNDGSVVKLFAEDACLMAPNAPALCGREGLAKFFKEAYEKGGVRNGKITTLNVYGDGREYVTEEGLYEVFDVNGKAVDEGKYLIVWKKTKDGWKDFRDSFNSNRPQK